MKSDRPETVEGLEARSLLLSAFQAPLDDAAQARSREEEARIRDDIERALPDVELLELLGRGGMGYVYRARQTKLDREVALKVVVPEPDERAVPDGPERFGERFEREARSLANLKHPGLVAVYDYGREDGLAWLMMEYVDGPNLREVIRAGELRPVEALALVPKICDALQYAHDHGIVHRDVKPENILLDGDGGVKIADFGLAKLVGSPAAVVALTGSQQVLGTLRYMAPEQLDRPLEVDHRADIYSLGVVLYEMLTGEIPMGRFEPPSARSTASQAVDPVVLRALEREPGRRYQRVRDVKSDLESAVDEGGSRAPRRGPSNSGKASARASEPDLSWKAVAACGTFVLGVPPFVFAAQMLLSLLASGGSRGVSVAVVLGSVSGVLGIVAFFVAGHLGFSALSEISKAWPKRYGVGAATAGAWGGLLLAAHVTAEALVVKLFEIDQDLLARSFLIGWLAATVALLVGVTFLRWAFVRRLRTTADA